MQAVILAAGEGKRVRPLTRSRPKALLPVANRPIIEYVIEALLKNGIRDIVVVVGYRKEQVIRFLNELNVPITVVVQNKQLGTAHALNCAKSHITGDFLLLPGDNYIDPHSIGRIKDIKNAMLVKEHPSPSNFGVVLLKDGLVSRIIEKPEHSPSFIVSTGIFSLTKDFFSFISENNITDAVSSMLASGEHLQAVVADDWQDAIYPWDLLKMNMRLLKDLPEAREGSVSRQTIIQGPVKIGKGTTIGPNTVITGPVIIGNDCEIGPNCCIMPNTSLGSRVKVEPFTMIGKSVIMDDTSIGSHSRVIDTVTGQGCRLADHTTISASASLMNIEEEVIKPEFGAVFGDQVTAGPFSIFKNCIVGNNVSIEGGSRVISRILPDESKVI
jgi:UDP-N-acetylglucosamine diphosphorylase / glucose-1-phosphate thymidylyltransferase / UDP-N-acetylgalactosamine diphosphorylase / glucosamine-1-phosphate N-acetyltransferase / galactosamine-1-phosphate N-acetyltransferase